MMINSIRIERMADHVGLLPLLKVWFQSEWPAYYGQEGSGDVESDLRAYSNGHGLPVGLVAFRDNEVCGVAALKLESIATRSDLGPWAGAGFVPPQHRRQGIGARLLGSVETAAREHGFPRIYCATSTSASLLERNAWLLLERVSHDGALISIYEKAL
jgi:GNAT superfamily N-acetyltransferase